MVQVNRLEAFYPPNVLQNVFAKLDRVDFRCKHVQHTQDKTLLIRQDGTFSMMVLSTVCLSRSTCHLCV